MSAYSRGACFERRVKKNYEGRGFLVIRSAGSHSPVDLVAIRAGEVILIQVKLDGRLSKIEETQLKEIEKETGCQVILAYQEKRKIYVRGLE